MTLIECYNCRISNNLLDLYSSKINEVWQSWCIVQDVVYSKNYPDSKVSYLTFTGLNSSNKIKVCVLCLKMKFTAKNYLDSKVHCLNFTGLKGSNKIKVSVLCLPQCGVYYGDAYVNMTGSLVMAFIS